MAAMIKELRDIAKDIDEMCLGDGPTTWDVNKEDVVKVHLRIDALCKEVERAHESLYGDINDWPENWKW